MKIENINQISEIPSDFKNIKIGLFTDNSSHSSLLFFCNLIDDSFSYFNLEEKIIKDLIKSDIFFNVLIINKNLNLKNIKLLLNYSNKHNVKLIYAPTTDSDLDSQKNLIKEYDLILIEDSNLKESFIGLNDNILTIPKNLNEEYEFIIESQLFDEENYISKYQLDSGSFNPILHYLTLGIYENCNPFKDIDVNNFLESYPEINKHDINPFTYYVILNKLFKFNNYYSFETIFEHPSLSRVMLWDTEDIVEELNSYLQKDYVNDFHFEIDEKNDRLLFKQQNRFSNFKYNHLIEIISKTNLLIKNRKTGKRILKEIKDFEVELTAEDLMLIDELDIYDIHVQMSTFNKDFNFRVKFDNQNAKKILIDKSNQRIFWAYETLDNHLAFKYQEASITIKSLEVVEDEDDLFLNGEIILLEDLDFDNVEILMSLNQPDFDRRYITCKFGQSYDTIQFSGKIDFEYYATDIGKNFKIDVRLKDEEGVILASRVLREYYMDDFKNDLRKYVKKAVFFESFHAKFYSGQPKYIYERMIERGFEDVYEFVWGYNGEEEIPGSPLIIERRSKNYDEILGASDYWITNMSFPFLKPREETVYLQTTHGTPYKRMGSDIETQDENVTKGRVLIESDTWNYILSPNDFCNDVFSRSFEYNGPIISKGYPANDIFYEDTLLKQQELKENLNIDPNKKIILYCPTFRDYDVDENNQKKFSHVIDLKKLYENIGDEYIILMRLHYSIAKHLVLSEEMQKSIIDLSDYDDIADLYLITDILITDYSSAFVDFAHSKKPILFFVPDFEEYFAFRGVYSEIKDNLPGPEIFDDDELVNCIKNIDDVEKQYAEKYEIFYDTYCKWGRGTATDDVINIVFGEVNNE